MQPSFPLSAAHRLLRHEQRNRVSRESDERRRNGNAHHLGGRAATGSLGH